LHVRELPAAKAQQHHTRVWQSISNHQLAEVLVARQDDAPLIKRDRQDFPIIERPGIVDRDGLNIVTQEPEEVAKASVNVLI